MTTAIEEKKASWAVLAMLAAAQFIMVLDTTVMNVSITQIVEDLNTTVVGLHLKAAFHEASKDQVHTDEDAFVDVCAVESIPDNCAKIATLADERIAVFRYGERISAVSNVCRHQNGPLGEGRKGNRRSPAGNARRPLHRPGRGRRGHPAPPAPGARTTGSPASTLRPFWSVPPDTKPPPERHRKDTDNGRTTGVPDA